MKVLVVDDDDDIRTITQLSLSEVGGMEVVEAADGRAAVDAALGERPDLILLDVMMPEMDGVQTLAALRSHVTLAQIPVVFLTAKALQSEIDRLLSFNVAAVFVKPFDPLTLADRLRDVARRVRLGQSPSGALASSRLYS
jgi:two-component system, OmpR family, response regulator